MVKDVPVSVFRGVLVVVEGNTTNNDTSNSPEHLQHLGRRSSQLDRHNLTAVCGSIGNENTPWQTLEDLCGEIDGERVSKVEDEDECIESHQASDVSPAVSDATGQRSGQEDTNKSSELSRYLEC